MEDIHEVLKKHWGYESFRPMQEDIIRSVLSGHDTLGLMPTGGGKSITFQVPGLALGGLTLVITPLVALMKDQVDNLRARGIKAAFMHAGMPYAETSRVWNSLVHGGCRFLYVSPERLENERFRQELRALKRVTLVVVDEAHCISQWGYDFRPSYLAIARLRKLLPPVPFMAVTASATPLVAEDICNVLEFRNRQIFRTSFARPNISYVVRPTEDKLGQICHILSRVGGTAIVYVRSRRRTVEIARALTELGIEARPFHAGMDYSLKESTVNEWKAGTLRVIVATNAFGMGIDKPDVRVVLHYDMPPSMEEYYQEAGRVGRDGKESYAVLLHSERDTARLRRRLSEAFPARDAIERIYGLLCVFLGLEIGEGYDRFIEFDMEKFCKTFSLQEQQVKGVLGVLAGSGYMQYVDERENASRLMILVNKEELYSLPGADARADGVLRALLRTRPGLFADYVYFSEQSIARDAGCTPEQVYDTLLSLARQGIVSYVPRKRTPYIHVLTGREDEKNLIIPRSVYHERREQMKVRIEAMAGYAENQVQCRPAKILAYFGEENPKPCGSCDVCRRERRRPLSEAELADRILRAIKDSGDKGLSPLELKNLFPEYAAAAFAIVAHMAEGGEVKYKQERYYA